MPKIPRSFACLLALSALSTFAAERPAIASPPELEASRRLFASWRTPAPAHQLIGNIYYVGASGVSSFLITTPAGHIVLDSAFEDCVPGIVRSIESLGFKVTDVKFILGSHAHIDHTGGHAALQKLTGAQIVSSAADAKLLASGGSDDFSPFPKELMRYTPVQANRIIADGESISLGGVTLTAHLTPGHTRGATTWTMDVEHEGKRLPVVFFSSLSIVEGTSLVQRPPYPEIVADFQATFAKLKALPCEVWLSPHGGQFSLAPKLARLDNGEKPNPFIDPAGWKRVLTMGEAAFQRQLEAERK